MSSAVLFFCPASDEFFHSRIVHMIDLRHRLAELALRMPRPKIEARVAQKFFRMGRAGVVMPELDLFGEQVQRASVSSSAGRPRMGAAQHDRAALPQVRLRRVRRGSCGAPNCFPTLAVLWR